MILKQATLIWHSFLYFLVLVILSDLSYTQCNNSTTFGVDIANHYIEINSGFNGTDILIFGTVNHGKIIIVVEGQLTNYIIRKKNKVSGFWIKNEAQNIKSPNFYVIATSFGALKQMSTQTRIEQRLDFRYIIADTMISNIHSFPFYKAFVDLKILHNMYQLLPKSINISSSGLFSINISLPAEISPGKYTVRALNVEQGNILQHCQTKFLIRKVGFGAQIHWLANEHPYFYGLTAVFISTFSGLLANYLFSRCKIS